MQPNKGGLADLPTGANLPSLFPGRNRLAFISTEYEVLLVYYFHTGWFVILEIIDIFGFAFQGCYFSAARKVTKRSPKGYALWKPVYGLYKIVCGGYYEKNRNRL